MRGDGRLYQRPGSPFYWCEYWNDGKCYRESTGQTDEEKAKKYLQGKRDERGAARQGGSPLLTSKQCRATVNELLDSLEADYTVRGKWNKSVASKMKLVRAHFATGGL